MVVEIRRVDFESIKPISFLHKESVDFKDNGVTSYIGAFIDGRIVGCVGYQFVGNVMRYKTDAVHPDYRNMGIYSKLWTVRELECAGKSSVTTAFCTKKSIHQYLKNGFEVQSKRGEIAFVKRVNKS